MSDHLNIGELAKATGVKIVTIRYYEQIGMLADPEQTEKNYRIYTRKHMERLRFIRRCRDLGFPLDQIRDMLRLSAQDSDSCQDICVIAERHLDYVEKKLTDLTRLATELRRIRSSCNGSRPMAECHIIEALTGASRRNSP